MYGLQDSTWKEWERKRRHTFIGFLFVGFSVGLDCSVVFSTLFLYLRDLVKTRQPDMWYGIIVAFFFISSTIFGTVFGRWLDKTRRVRIYVNVTLLVQILGFVLYTIPTHAAFLLVGRTICGISDSFASVASGEVFRIYDKKESTVAMIWLSSSYVIGFMIGPALNFLFTEINFNIGPVQINYLNFIGIFMSALLVIGVVIVNFLVHDCSLQFDLKNHLKVTSEDVDVAIERSGIEVHCDKDELPKMTPDVSTNTCDEVKNTTDTMPLVRTIPSQIDISIQRVVKALLSNKDTLLILVATIIFMYGVFALSALFPLLMTITLKWNIKYVSLVYVGFGVYELVVFFLLAKYVKSNRSIYITCLVCIASQIVNCCLLICFKVLPRDSKRDIVLVIAFVITLVLCYCFEVMIKVILAKMVPSNIQSFSESLRCGVSRVVIVGGSFTVAIMLPWAHWWSAAVISVHFILLVAFLIRKTHLINPVEIPFESQFPCRVDIYGNR